MSTEPSEADIARKYHRPAPKVTWGPALAIIGTLVIYMVSVYAGSIVLGVVAMLRNIPADQLAEWSQQTWPQFFYILVVETLVLSFLALLLHMRKATFKTLGLVKPIWRDVGYAFLGFLIYLPVLLVTTVLVRAFIPGVNLDQQQQIGFAGSHGPLALVIVFVSLVILPPVTEEILARGFLYLGLRKKLPLIWAALLTSAVFAVAHLQFGSGAPLLWSAAIDTFILSLVLIYVREKTGALWASIGLHMLKNFLAFSVLFIFT